MSAELFCEDFDDYYNNYDNEDDYPDTQESEEDNYDEKSYCHAGYPLNECGMKSVSERVDVCGGR